MWQKRIGKKIDRLLIEAKLITKKQLANALERQKESGLSLGKNLVDLDYISEDEIAQYIAEQYRLPYISLDRCYMNKGLLHAVPESISKAYGIIPIDLIGDILTVGIVDMPDEEVIKRIQEFTGFKIQIMVITAGDFTRYIQEAYNLSVVDNHKQFDKIEMGKYVKAPSYSGKERRRFPRFNKKLKIKYEFRNEYNINSSINVSQGGILIKSKSPVPVDSHIVIRLELPVDHHEDIIVISRVVRVEQAKDKNSYLIALDFSSMSAADNRKLAEFIKAFKK